MTNNGADSAGVKYSGMVDCLSRVYAEGGLPRLFSGVSARVMWITIGGFVFFGSYEQAKAAISSFES